METITNITEFLTKKTITDFPPKLGVWRLMGFEKFGKSPKILLYSLSKEGVEKYISNARAHGYVKVYVEFSVYQLSSCETLEWGHQKHYYYSEVRYGFSKTGITGGKVHQGTRSYGDQIRIICGDLVKESLERDQQTVIKPKAWAEYED